MGSRPRSIIAGRLFDDDGNQLGDPFVVEGNTSAQSGPPFTLPQAVAHGAGFAVEWIDVSSSAGESLNAEVFANAPAVGTPQADSLSGTAGNDIIIGLAGDDVLMGLASDDQLQGGVGNDILSGGPGTDTLTGGPGNDIFQGTRSDLNGDHITDINSGDLIDVNSADFSSFSYSRDGTTLNLGQNAILDIGLTNVRFATVAGSYGDTELIATDHYAGLNDFNGDGHSDILWRNGNGQFTEWQASGNGATNQLTPNIYGNADVGIDWHIAETFDFNGDGLSDILWRNGTTGQFTVWEGAAGGSGFAQNAYSDTSVGTNWSIAAAGDLNGDGKDDLIWHNAITGEVTTWQSTGTGFAENVAVYTGIPTDWQVVGAGDFNGDGMADLLWRNQTTGAFTTWSSTGANFDTNVYTNTSVDLAWHVQGIADFDGDGKDDLLWRNATNGKFTIWTSTGTGFTPNTYVDASVGTDWQIAQIGDFNDDGKADILWRNTANGEFTIWQSNGHGFDENVVVNTSVDPSWHIQSHDYLFG